MPLGDWAVAFWKQPEEKVESPAGAKETRRMFLPPVPNQVTPGTKSPLNSHPQTHRALSQEAAVSR